MNSCYTCIVQAALPAAWSWKFGTVTKTLCSLMHVLWGWGRHVGQETSIVVMFADRQVCKSRRRYLISFLYAHIRFRLQLAIFFTRATSVVTSHLGSWNCGMPQISGACGNPAWMFCEWFPSRFITSLERLDLCLHHMRLHSLDSCSEVGKDSPNESVYASNGQVGFRAATLLTVVKNTCCFLVCRE